MDKKGQFLWMEGTVKLQWAAGPTTQVGDQFNAIARQLVRHCAEVKIGAAPNAALVRGAKALLSKPEGELAPME